MAAQSLTGALTFPAEDTSYNSRREWIHLWDRAEEDLRRPCKEWTTEQVAQAQSIWEQVSTGKNLSPPPWLNEDDIETHGAMYKPTMRAFSNGMSE